MMVTSAVPPLGVHVSEHGVSVALFSAHADAVDLCLFDKAGNEARRPLTLCRDQVFFDYFEDLKPGDLYGFRATGPWQPEAGHRFNPNKLLIDPYARALDRTLRFDPAQLDIGKDPDANDSATTVAKAVIVPPLQAMPAGPSIPLEQSLIYEAHIKGLTQRHPDIPAASRGRFSGLTHPVMIDHLVKLGVRAVELLPVQAFITEPRLEAMGLANYWGYNTIGFFAPHPAYSSNDGSGLSAIYEFRHMVQTLHEAGIEIILDVVYNHSGESDHLGPTLAFKGLDNASYYRLERDKRAYANPTGCGNALDTSQPFVTRMIMDSLRYWAIEMGVDGFRFDLATTLARGPGRADLVEGSFDSAGTFLTCLMQDPVLSQKKLIMEPWDIGHDGYKLGGFPAGTSEWNDRFRDSIRRFWRGDPSTLQNMGASLAGSADHFDHHNRAATASINFVTSHDGFTLHDMTAYKTKHNEANGEQNRDGHNHNFSTNHGIEGDSDDSVIQAIRARHARNMAASLLLAQGTPMWLGGDELLRSQQGNNNAYCQDNPISWIDWSMTPNRQAFLAFVQELSQLRHNEPLLCQSHFLHTEDEIRWHHHEGRLMTDADWHNPDGRTLGMELRDQQTRLLILVNASNQTIDWQLEGTGWQTLLSTATAIPKPAETTLTLEHNSLTVLKKVG